MPEKSKLSLNLNELELCSLASTLLQYETVVSQSTLRKLYEITPRDKRQTLELEICNEMAGVSSCEAVREDGAVCIACRGRQ